MSTNSSTKTPKIGRPKTKPPVQCKSCGVDIPVRSEIDGAIRPAYGRTYCFSCVPLGTKKRKHLDLSKEGQRQDLLGKIVGNWTLVREGPRYGSAQMRTYVCRCTCGFERTFPVSYINTGTMGCCSNCREAQRQEEFRESVAQTVGTKKGSYTIVSYEKNNKYGTRMWRCRCECGTEVVVSTAHFNLPGRLKCRQCVSHHLELENRVTTYIPCPFWKKQLYSARKRDIDISVTKEQALQLFLSQGGRCALSNTPLYFTRLGSNKYTTASIDRIDSSKGYEMGNIQWVHKKVNMMKGSFTQEEFIEICHEISKNRK